MEENVFEVMIETLRVYNSKIDYYIANKSYNMAILVSDYVDSLLLFKSDLAISGIEPTQQQRYIINTLQQKISRKCKSLFVKIKD